jgi:hypothetical protein
MEEFLLDEFLFFFAGIFPLVSFVSFTIVAAAVAVEARLY